MTTGADGRHGTGEQARRQAVQHHEPGDRHGEEVGDGADQRQPAEHEQARHGDAELGAERDRQRQRQRTEPARAAAPGAAPRTVTPAVAPTDNQNPTDQASSGSSSSRPITATASRRSGSRSRPSANAVAPSPAIAPARSTDGSARVRTTNQPISASDAAHRATGRGPAQQRAGRGQHEARRSARTRP